jgi:hypothetical protein
MMGLFSMRCRVRDGGAGRLFVRWPSVVALQEEATNHPKVLRSRAVGAERWGKRRACEHVGYDPMKANESEPQMKCRNALDDIKSGECSFPVMSLVGACLLTRWCPACMRRERGSGSCMERGNLSSRGTVSQWSVTCGWSDKGRTPNGGIREDKSTYARHRGGPPGSSDEGPVMGLERSGRAVQTRLLGNHEVVGRANG